MPDILIVEDEILIAEEIKECLIRHGFGVTQLVVSGEEALSAIAVKMPDAVVMDIKLPGEMDGIATAEKIYKRWRIPCIFLTSYSNPSFLDRAKQVGASGYIVKPFDDFELTAMLELTLYKAQMEAEKQRIEAQLHQAMKMEALGTLAGGIAHDFNNIIGIILGYSELIENDLTAAKMNTDSIKEVLTATHRAKELVQQILTFSRKNDNAPQPTEINTLVDNALKFLRSSLPKTIDINIEVKEYAIFVLIDPAQMLQILMNLCTNAAQVMEKTGGTITIQIAVLPQDAPELENLFSGSPHSTYIRLSVSDNGPGISADIQSKIFDPYFTTKVFSHGSGLGLSVVHGIVQKNNGEISVESAPGKGCSFHIYLPEVESLPVS